jgi:hypothetical protein
LQPQISVNLNKLQFVFGNKEFTFLNWKAFDRRQISDQENHIPEVNGLFIDMVDMGNINLPGKFTRLPGFKVQARKALEFQFKININFRLVFMGFV